MTPAQALVANAAWVGICVTLIGIFARHRWRLCRSFAVYLACCLVTNRLIAWWPSTFYNLHFYALKEVGLILLHITVSVELTLLLMAALRGVRRIAVATVMAVALVGCAGAIAMEGSRATPGLSPAMQAAVSTCGMLSAAGVWTLVAFLLVAQWYRLPIHPWHRDITLGFLLYGGVYSVLLGLTEVRGSSMYHLLVVWDPSAYTATVLLWAIAAWRRTNIRPRDAVRALQPWAQP